MNKYHMLVKHATEWRTDLGLTLCNDPLPTRKVYPSKYDAIFSSMKLGQALKCKDHDETMRVAGAMRKWIAKNGHKHLTARCVSKYTDGKGRVWLMHKK